MALLFVLLAFVAHIMLAFASPVLVPTPEVTHSGWATYYAPDPVPHALGACGWENTSNQMVVAMGLQFFEQNGGGNCGQFMEINYNGKTAYAMMVDACPACGEYNLDLSPAVMKQLAPNYVQLGKLEGVSWNFMNRNYPGTKAAP